MSEDVVEVMAEGLVGFKPPFDPEDIDRQQSWTNAVEICTTALAALTEGGWAVVAASPSADMCESGALTIYCDRSGVDRSKVDYLHAKDTELAEDIYVAMIKASRDHAPTTCAAKDQGAATETESGHGALPMPSPELISAGERLPSDHLLICIPAADSGLSVTVDEFPGDPGAAQDAFFEADAKGWYAEILTIYRHHGRGVLDNKWWGGAWTGYRKRFDAFKSSEEQSRSLSNANAGNQTTDTPNTSSLPNTIREGE